MPETTQPGAPRLLHVDDDPRVRELVREILAEAADRSWTFCEGEDGGQAQQLVASHRPDVVLMDIAMPGVDGLAATRSLCAAHPGIHVVVLTQFDSRKFRIAAEAAGACAYVLKEDLAALPAVLEGLLDSANPGQASGPGARQPVKPRL